MRNKVFKTLFYKLSGAGNNFWFAWGPDLFAEIEAKTPRSKINFIKKICSQGYGLGSDGIVFLWPGSKKIDYIWDFYNADGSTAEMCGNAARCAGRFIHDVLKSKKSRISIGDKRGPLFQCEINIRRTNQEFKVLMPKIRTQNAMHSLKILSSRYLVSLFH